MNRAIIKTYSWIQTSLGSLSETVDALFCGESGITPAPTGSVPVPSAPFKHREMQSLHQCFTEAKKDMPQLTASTDRTVFLYAAAKGDLSGFDENGEQSTNSPLLSRQAESVASTLGLADATYITISNACASGVIALEHAVELLQAGIYDQAVICGYESLSHFIVSGFYSLGALSPDSARPFDKKRNGLVLGEGAAVTLLTAGTPEKHDICIAGCGSSNDANHRTGPSRTGEGLYRAASAALRNAALEPGDIGAVKCHGTATNYNDAMEAKALYRLFGSTQPPACSVKGALGHTSGGGSLAELCIAAEFLRRKKLPPTPGFEMSGVEEPISVSTTEQQFSKNWLLCLSAGFGGVNSATIIGECQ